ncbi:MAG: glycosyltransferase family 2 protein [Nanoarchaeota archaeon]
MKPLVSFLIPVYNDEKHIGNTLQHLETQDYPKDRIEIIIADGSSTDKTVEIVRKFMQKNRNIKLYKNPRRNTAVGRNICLTHAKGKYIFNFSSHCYASKDFVSTLVKKLEKYPKKVMAVGVSSNPPGQQQGFVSNSIILVFSTAFGGFKSTDQNIMLKEERPVRSVAFTAYRREIFDIVGNFDEELWCGQDGELNLRINKAGYQIIFTPDTTVSLQKRDSLRKFYRQMYKYGLGAMLRIKKHPDSFKLIYAAPSIGALAILAGVLISSIGILIGNYLFVKIFFGLLALYTLLGFISALFYSRKLLLSLASPLFYFILHFSYGHGFLRGLFAGRFEKKD